MTTKSPSLASIYEGWEGYQRSILHAFEPLTTDQLAYRPAPDQRSVAELVRHIACGRLGWFLRMDAPGSAELAARFPGAHKKDGSFNIAEAAIPLEREEIIRWLEMTWGMVEKTLNEWTVDDLQTTYRHTYWNNTYAVSRQWTIWRILSHDIHHGGQLSLMLYMQGIDIPELGSLGGHLTEPPFVTD